MALGLAGQEPLVGRRNLQLHGFDRKSACATAKSGGATANPLPILQLTLLRTLILWAVAYSETVKGLINQSYKQNRHEDDLNQPRAVKPWGSDGDKRRYFLVEGQDDTNFRVYRESNPAGTARTWWSVAGTIEELKALAHKLATKDGGPKARTLSHKIISAIPRFEAGEEVGLGPLLVCNPRVQFSRDEGTAAKWPTGLTMFQKRKRREYRQMRKEKFKRPDPGFSLYEGRTRGKRMKYTYSDDDDNFMSDSTGNRRSARNTGTNTPAEIGPVTTSSGRQARAPPRLNMVPGESAPESVQGDGSEYDQNTLGSSGRPKRSAAVNQMANGLNGAGWRRNGSADTDDDGGSEAGFGDEENDADAHITQESEDEEEFEEDEVDPDEQPQRLIVRLSVTPPRLRTVLVPSTRVNSTPTPPENQVGQVNACAADTVMLGTPEVPVQDSISVVDVTSGEAINAPPAAAEEPFSNDSAPPSTSGMAREQASLTAAATSLAFRSSPEKISGQLMSPRGGG